MTALFRTDEIRALEAAHAAKHPKTSLMQRAGTAAAKFAATLVEQKKGAAILVLAGPGNNGGDAWVAAAALKKSGQRVTVVALGEQKISDPAAKAGYAAFKLSKDRVRKEIPADEHFDLIIDGIFGIGLTRAPAGAFANAIAGANAREAPILSLDVPSGLSSDTGAALGEAIVATHTLTFLGLKPGLFTAAGKDHAGEVHLETLGVATPATPGALLIAANMRELIPQRLHQSHKGSYGNVGVIGGAEGMVGAAVLAARAALYMGPGKVTLGIAAKEPPAYDPLNPELMVKRADDVLADESISALAVGMGLGTDKSAPRLVNAALARPLPTVLDADALNVMASNPSIGAAWQAKMVGTPLPSLSLVITPHPGEASRLLSVTVQHLQADRVTSAIALARKFNAVAVLKGSGTVIAAPDGRYFVNSTGNPGMASGGMGDALSGMIASFLAQGLPALDAACLSVFLHGLAADECVAHGMAPHGLTASEVMFEARTLLNAGLEHHDH